MADLKPHTPVTQHFGRDDQRDGRIVSVNGDYAIVRFDVGNRRVPVSTLTEIADLRNVNDFDNCDGT